MRVFMNEVHTPHLPKLGTRMRRGGLAVVAAAALGIVYLSTLAGHTVAIVSSDLGFSPVRDVMMDLKLLPMPLVAAKAEASTLDSTGMEYVSTFSK